MTSTVSKTRPRSFSRFRDPFRALLMSDFVKGSRGVKIFLRDIYLHFFHPIFHPRRRRRIESRTQLLHIIPLSIFLSAKCVPFCSKCFPRSNEGKGKSGTCSKNGNTKEGGRKKLVKSQWRPFLFPPCSPSPIYIILGSNVPMCSTKRFLVSSIVEQCLLLSFLPG